MKTGGKILSEIMHQAIQFVSPGKDLAEINRFIEKEIDRRKVKPSFKQVRDYRWASCLNLNEGVVHGIPHPGVKISRGDYVSIDVGILYGGYHTDMAYTFKVGEKSSQDEFLQTGKRALSQAISVVKNGVRVGEISREIENTIEGNGYACIDSLTGHGIGKVLHQEPFIPLVLTEPIEKTPIVLSGQALAIEVIYTQGRRDVSTQADGWTIITQDGKISALFEKTVFVDDYQGEVLTPFFWEEDVQ